MNKVSGKIVLKESGVGVPDLLVVVYDVDSGTQPEDVVGTKSVGTVPSLGQGFAGDRLGFALTDSSATDKRGTFELTYEDDEFRIRNPEEKRPDLFLFVLAPEEAGNDPRILFASVALRENAGRTEQYLIRLTAEQLEKAGVPLPTTPNDEIEEPQRTVQRIVRANSRLDAIDQGFRSIDKQRVEQIRQTALGFQTKVRPAFRRMLSRVPETLVDPDAFVAPGESVFEKGNAIIRRGIEQVVNSDDPKVRAPVTGFVALTAAQKDALAGHLEGGAIDSEALEGILNGDEGRQRSTTFVVREDPLIQFCREKSQDEAHCLAILEDGPDDGDAPEDPENGDVPGPGVTAITEQDINQYVARLMDTMTSPEERVVSGLEPRADRAKVEENIRTLAFPPSPADTPAFHNFHNLQIAFEHVWEEAIDEGILDLAEDAYQDIVELGGDPDRDSDEGRRNPARALTEEGRIVLTSRRIVRDHHSEVIDRDQRGKVRVRNLLGRETVTPPATRSPPRGRTFYRNA